MGAFLRFLPIFILLAGCLCRPTFAFAQAVAFPGAVGFGSETRHAYSHDATPDVCKVNSTSNTTTKTLINDYGSWREYTGTIRGCYTHTAAKIIVFERSGMVTLNTILKTNVDGMSIFGETAPSPGFFIRAGQLEFTTGGIVADDIVIRHIAILPGDEKDVWTTLCENRTAVRFGTSHRVVVDRSHLGLTTDQIYSAAAEGGSTTVSRSILGPALHRSCHEENPGADHGYGPLYSSQRSTFGHSTILNFQFDTTERADRSRGRRVEMVNKMFWNFGGNSLFANGDSSNNGDMPFVPYRMDVNVVNSLWLGGTKTTNYGKVFYALANTGANGGFSNDSRVFLEGNFHHNVALTQGSRTSIAQDNWSIVGSRVDSSLRVNTYADSLGKSGTIPVAPYNAQQLKTWMVTNKNVGMRPKDMRNPAYADVYKFALKGLDEAAAGTGTTWPDCVDASDCVGSPRVNLGGWPVVPANSRTFTVTSDAHVVQPNGYTKIENDIRVFALDIEEENTGATPTPTPTGTPTNTPTGSPTASPTPTLPPNPLGSRVAPRFIPPIRVY